MAAVKLPIDDTKSSLFISHILSDYFERWSKVKGDAKEEGKFKDGSQFLYLDHMKNTINNLYLDEKGNARDSKKINMDDVPFMFLPHTLKDTSEVTTENTNFATYYGDRSSGTPLGSKKKIQASHGVISPKFIGSDSDLAEFKAFWERTENSNNIIQDGTKHVIDAYAKRYGVDVDTSSVWSLKKGGNGSTKDGIMDKIIVISNLDWFTSGNTFGFP